MTQPPIILIGVSNNLEDAMPYPFYMDGDFNIIPMPDWTKKCENDCPRSESGEDMMCVWPNRYDKSEEINGCYECKD